MEKTIRILMNEEDPEQVALNEHELRRKGISFTARTTSNEEEFVKALKEFKPDIILTDYRLPTFDAMTALRLVQERKLPIPVVIVTGSIDEETAAGTIKAGAADYVLKSRLPKLATAVEGALEKERIFKDKVRAEKELQEAYRQIRENSEKLKKTNTALEDARVYAESIIRTVRHPLLVLDEDLRVASANAEFYQLFAVSEEETVGRLVYELGDRQWDRNGLRTLLREVIPNNKEFVNYSAEGDFPTIGHKIMKLSGRRIDQEGGRRSLILLSIEDVTGQVHADEALKRHEYEFRTLVENSPDIIERFDQRYRYLYANPVIEQITGIPREKFIGKTRKEMGMSGDIAAKLESTLQEAFSTAREVTTEYSLPGPFGNRYFLMRVVPEFFSKLGIPESVMAISRDITLRKAAEERVKYVSFHDSLTGVYNRLYFEEELNRLDKGREIPISIIMGDINFLKLANDMFGHEAGDQLLIKIAEVLKSVSRNGDVIARWGGDEFTLLLPRTDYDTARRIAGRIEKACSETPGAILPPSVALGVATKENDGENIYRVQREAEEIMYKNKIMKSKQNIQKMVNAILNKIDEKDGNEQEHNRRLQDTITDRAKNLGLSDEQTNELIILVSFHDIGKIAVHEGILTKTGKLTPEEWDIMKKIPEVGYRIAKVLSEVTPTAEAVLTLRERWDGTGYPKGLKGEEIPFLSRLFAIIDAFDVMTHPRHYARALTQEEAIEELRRNAGKQFDSDMVDRFIKTISKHPVAAAR